MKTLTILILLALFSSFIDAGHYATYTQNSIVTSIDTLWNGMIRVNIQKVDKEHPLEPGKLKTGDTVKLLTLRRVK